MLLIKKLLWSYNCLIIKPYNCGNFIIMYCILWTECISSVHICISMGWFICYTQQQQKTKLDYDDLPLLNIVWCVTEWINMCCCLNTKNVQKIVLASIFNSYNLSSHNTKATSFTEVTKFTSQLNCMTLNQRSRNLICCFSKLYLKLMIIT